MAVENCTGTKTGIFLFIYLFMVRSRSSKQKSGQECRIDCRPQGDLAVLQAQKLNSETTAEAVHIRCCLADVFSRPLHM
jgi:hypothetical protein